MLGEDEQCLKEAALLIHEINLGATVIGTGITANRERLRASVENSIGIFTALNPYIGYENATKIAQEAAASGRSVYDLVLERKLLTKARLDEIMRPDVLTQPRRCSPAAASSGRSRVHRKVRARCSEYDVSGLRGGMLPRQPFSWLAAPRYPWVTQST